MKQRINNQKVINWHAPRKAGALSGFYIEKRTHGSDNLSIKKHDTEEIDFCVYCNSWRCYDGGSIVRCNRLSAADYDVIEFTDGTEGFVNRIDKLCDLNWKNIERKFAFSNPILLPLEMVEEANAVLFEERDGSERIQEADLAGHYQYLKAADPQNSCTLVFDPRDVLRVENVLGHHTVSKSTEARPSLIKNFDATFLALFLGHSIRSLSHFNAISGDAREDFQNLAEYLFCDYPIPQCLKAFWGVPKSAIDGDLKKSVQMACWFICLGQGGSLRKLAKFMGGRVAGKFVHFLYEAPSHLRPEMACTWAEAMRISGVRRVADWISQSQGYAIDPSFVPSRQHQIRFRKFWQQTVKWFARFEDELSDEVAAELLEWGNVRFGEDSKKNILFSWAGRTPASAQEVARRELPQFFRGLGGTANLQWVPLGLSWNWETTALAGAKTDVWTFVELTQSSDLWEEGVAMGNCVAGYDQKCMVGISAIVSVRLNGMRVLTAELNRRSKAVVQVKGRFNREPTAAESAVVAQWHREVVVGRRGEVFALAA